MLQRTFFFCLLFGCSNLWALDDQEVGSGAQHTLKEISSQNPKTWAPGEPLTWLGSDRLEPLLGMGLDQFRLFVASPRKPGYKKTIHYLKDAEGHEVIWAEGDLRFISYTPTTRENHSRSAVVGYSYESTPYLLDGRLNLQNGQSNWYRHAHRHYHSQASGEIEMKETEAAPFGVESAAKFVSDSGCYFLCFSGKLEEFEGPVPVHFLAHTSSSWALLGQLNPAIRRMVSTSQFFNLDDYFIATYSGSITAIRKSDRHVTQCPSNWALNRRQRRESNQGQIAGNCIMFRGNEVGFLDGDSIVFENIDSLLKQASWIPLITPLNEPLSEGGARSTPLESIPFQFYLPIVLISFLVGAGIVWFGRYRMTERALTMNSAPAVLDSSLGHLLVDLSKRKGTEMTTQQMDEFLKLDRVSSPETRRARRSREIQLLNLQAVARFGSPILERKRQEQDRRVIVYHILNVAD